MGFLMYQQKLRAFFASQPDIEFALIFGSVAAGRNNLLSDLDVAVYFSGEKDSLDLGERQIDIICALMRICKISRVDAVILNLADPFLSFQVIKYGRLVFAADERAFYKFKIFSLGRYQDIRSMYELYNRAAAINLRRGLDNG